MTIAEMRERCNGVLSSVTQDVLVVAVVILASSAAFGLGMLAGKGTSTTVAKDGFWVEELATSSAALPAAAGAAPVVSSKVDTVPLPTNASAAVITPTEGKYVASKSGTKYYLPSCSGAARIKEENKIWFATEDAATAAGYGPASTCKGL